MQLRQLPLAGGMHGYNVCSLRARVGPGELGQLYYRGTLGVHSRVYGPGGQSRSRVGAAGKTACDLFPIEKKCDVHILDTVRPTAVVYVRSNDVPFAQRAGTT